IPFTSSPSPRLTAISPPPSQLLEAAVPTASRLACFLRCAAAVPLRRLCSSALVPPRTTLLGSNSVAVQATSSPVPRWSRPPLL
ncbi:hypothetical protein HN873_029201, partial [Arachis hypogaea]